MYIRGEEVIMDKRHVEEVMDLDANEYTKTFQEIIEKIEKEFIQKGIILEVGIKHLNYLCNNAKLNIK